MAVKEAERRSYRTPEDELRECYSWRCLECFTVFLGLAEIKTETHRLYPRSFELRKTRLLDQAVILNL